MTRASQILSELAGAGVVQGRHVVVTAHADDEAITFGAALRRLADAVIVQLTTGVPNRGGQYPDQVFARRAERTAAAQAGGWSWPTVDGNLPARDAHHDLPRVLDLISAAVAGADVVWTHPYEHGHLDHDTAAWAVQRVCQHGPLRMEFASYHATADRRLVFGAFFPCASAGHVTARLSGVTLERKLAAVAAYESQAHIARKFPALDVEHYRVAPVYDFRKPAPPSASRWDVKGYTPPMAEWRQAIAAFEREAA